MEYSLLYIFITTKTYHMKTPGKLLRTAATGMLLLAASFSFAQQQPGLARFEGVFQKSDNKEAYLQFTVKNGILTGKQLWNGQEYELVRKSDTDFVSKDEEYPVTFIKDGTGEVIKTKIMNRSEWIRVKDYKPRQPATLTAAQLKPLEGRYRFRQDNNLYLSILVRDSAIVLKQSWDGKEVQLVPESELVFFSPTQFFPAAFTKDAGGKITAITCFHKDVWDKVE